MLHQTPWPRLRELYRLGEVSPMDVARSALEHAERADPIINAFALLDRAGTLAGARESEERWRQGAALGPLDGMPVAIKEFAAVRGWPTRRGSALTSAEPAAAHTVFVQRLADAGAVLLGKTRAPEFNWKGITDSPAFGITRNPWNPSLTPGGRQRLRGGRGRRRGAPVHGQRRGRLDPHPGRLHRHHRPEAHARAHPLSPLPSAFANIVHTGPIAAGMDELQEAYLATRGASPLDWTSNLGEDGGADAPAARPASACCRPGAGAHAAPRRCAPRWTRRWPRCAPTAST